MCPSHHLMSFVAFLCLLVGMAQSARAAEGMYLLDKLPVERLKKSGLKIPHERLSRLSKAVVQVARGGTGSFVSPDGLLVTNHHVAYGCIARLGARKEHLGLLERGHVAKSRADELHCPGYDLLAVREVRDVTKEVLKAVKPRMRWARNGSDTAPRPIITSLQPLTARQRAQSATVQTSPLAVSGMLTASAIRAIQSQWAGGR